MSTLDLHAALTTALYQKYTLAVSQAWLSAFLTQLASNNRPTPPLPALTSTAHFRILASDIRSSLVTSSPTPGGQRVHFLPLNITDPAVKETRLAGPVVVQLVDIADVGASKWSQVEAIERVERGEEVRGREVIRTVSALEDGGEEDEVGLPTPAATAASGGNGNGMSQRASHNAKRSNGPHRLILQDAKGTKAVAFEMEPIPKLWVGDEGLGIGCKFVLVEGALVRRGSLMLQSAKVKVLGGKVELWDREWKHGRKERLIADVSGTGQR
jgi:RecQ-mediated genome instability protein 1